MWIKIDESLLEFPRSKVTYVRMSEAIIFEVDPKEITFYVGGRTVKVGKNQAGKMYDSVLAQLNAYLEVNAV